MQEPELDETRSVLENVQDGVRGMYDKLERFNAISMLMSEPDADFDTLLAEMGELQEAIDHADAWDLDSQLEQAMDALRCRPSDSEIGVLSGGEKRRVALCKLLLEKPDLLLLDEPTNHLDAESVLWLEQHLAKYPGAVIAITHDRYFLDHVAQWIAEVDRGRLYPTRVTIRPTSRRRPNASKCKARRTPSSRSASPRNSTGFVQTPRAVRQIEGSTRPIRRDGDRSRAHQEARLRGTSDSTRPASRSNRARGDKVKKGFGERVLIDNFSFSLPRNGIVGIIGPNGVGKSTLFKTIVGLEPLDSGSLKVGETVKISYVDQSRTGIDPNKTSGRSCPKGSMSSRSAMSRFRLAHTSRRSASRVRTSRRRPEFFRVESATASTLH
jgi:ATPase subunit of ABC transporter with duplicated ATPase domains